MDLPPLTILLNSAFIDGINWNPLLLITAIFSYIPYLIYGLRKRRDFIFLGIMYLVIYTLFLTLKETIGYPFFLKLIGIIFLFGSCALLIYNYVKENKVIDDNLKYALFMSLFSGYFVLPLTGGPILALSSLIKKSPSFMGVFELVLANTVLLLPLILFFVLFLILYIIFDKIFHDKLNKMFNGKNFILINFIIFVIYFIIQIIGG